MKEIGKRHPEFELTYDLLLGIRVATSLDPDTSGNEHNDEEDYSSGNDDDQEEKFDKDSKRYLFPSTGSYNTPSHAMEDFEFKDYCRATFAALRKCFGMEPSKYLIKLCGSFKLLEFISNSKSGQFFFYSHDGQFLIKSMTHSECKFLRQILPHYYQHVTQQSGSLLTKFYGMYRVKAHQRQPIYFVVMGSVFYTDLEIHRIYDLKGSTHGRRATQKEKLQETPVLKDLDWLDDGAALRIGKEKAELCKKQLKSDLELLRKMEIMDYSLLVGIHYCDRSVGLGQVELDTQKTKEKDKDSNKIDDIDKNRNTNALKQNESRSPTDESVDNNNFSDNSSNNNDTKKSNVNQSTVHQKKLSTISTSSKRGLTVGTYSKPLPLPPTKQPNLDVHENNNKNDNTATHVVSNDSKRDNSLRLASARPLTLDEKKQLQQSQSQNIVHENDTNANNTNTTDKKTNSIGPSSSQTPSTPSASEEISMSWGATSNDEDNQEKKDKNRVSSRRLSQIGTEQALIVKTPLEKHFDAPEIINEKEENDMTPFGDDHGGICCVDENGNKGNEIYFIGIIDVLQKYNKGKKFENFIRGIQMDTETISAVPPEQYARRMYEFLKDKIM